MSNINPFKDRVIDLTKKVYVYRNLNCRSEEDRFSIMQSGLVVGHTNELYLSDVEFVIRKSGKKKAIETGVRNVHAFIRGYIVDNLDTKGYYSKITYNPFNKKGFMCLFSQKEIKKCEAIIVQKGRLLAYNPTFSSVVEKKIKKYFDFFLELCILDTN